MNDTHPVSGTITRTHVSPIAALWAGAAVLTALIIVQAGRGVEGLDAAAQAEMVSEVGDFTMMTTDAGNEEIVLVLDARSEDLSIYRVDQQTTLELYQRVNLQRIFGDARVRSRSDK